MAKLLFLSLLKIRIVEIENLYGQFVCRICIVITIVGFIFEAMIRN